jgi:hypothetical protein
VRRPASYLVYGGFDYRSPSISIYFGQVAKNLFYEGCSMSGMAQTRASGILFALSAGILWGFVPVYINFFGNVDPLEIVAHRSLWSLVMLFGLVIWRRQISMA